MPRYEREQNERDRQLKERLEAADRERQRLVSTGQTSELAACVAAHVVVA